MEDLNSIISTPSRHSHHAKRSFNLISSGLIYTHLFPVTSSYLIHFTLSGFSHVCIPSRYLMSQWTKRLKTILKCATPSETFKVCNNKLRYCYTNEAVLLPSFMISHRSRMLIPRFCILSSPSSEYHGPRRILKYFHLSLLFSLVSMLHIPSLFPIQYHIFLPVI